MICREVFFSMKLKTVRVRRSRPSVLSLALALMLTMLCVYILSLSGSPIAQPASAQAVTEAEIHLPGLQSVFQCAGRYALPLDAHLAAARCVQSGGAGLVILDGEEYAVVERAGGDAGESSFTRSANGLTLRARGMDGDLRAISEAALFLQSLQGETAALADALARGDTNASSISALMNVYRTQGERAQDALICIQSGSVAVSFLLDNVEDALVRLECVMEHPTAAHLRQLHAAACVDWISLLENLNAMAQSEAPAV